MTTGTLAVETRVTDIPEPESELRAAARRCGLIMTELAAQLGVRPILLAAAVLGAG